MRKLSIVISVLIFCVVMVCLVHHYFEKPEVDELACLREQKIRYVILREEGGTGAGKNYFITDVETIDRMMGPILSEQVQYEYLDKNVMKEQKSDFTLECYNDQHYYAATICTYSRDFHWVGVNNQYYKLSKEIDFNYIYQYPIDHHRKFIIPHYN